MVYVTRNPLEAGLAADARALEHFRWCGLGALLGHRPPRPFEATSETLALFAADPQHARQHLCSRLGGPELAVQPPLTLETTPSTPALVPPIGFDGLMRDVCDRFLVTGDELRSRCRSPHLAAARSALARQAAADLGLAGAEIARRLGMTRAAISVMLARKPAEGAAI